MLETGAGLLARSACLAYGTAVKTQPHQPSKLVNATAGLLRASRARGSTERVVIRERRFIRLLSYMFC